MKLKSLVRLRRLSQLCFAGLFIYILWSTTYPLSGSLPTSAIFKSNPLLMLLASLSERVLLEGAGYAFLMIALTLILGRFFCGWVCPLGALFDLVGWLFQAKKLLPQQAAVNLRSAKFFILLMFFFSSILGLQIVWGLDPVVISARFISLNFIPSVTFALENIFSFLIQATNHYEPLFDLYRGMKSSVLGIKAIYFSHAQIIFLEFILILSTLAICRRFWCRAICPLGGFYAGLSFKARLTRRISGCVHCGKCYESCRMQAINKDASYVKEECVLCMDCVYDCPAAITRFGFYPEQKRPPTICAEKGLTRRSFLAMLASAAIPSAGVLLGNRYLNLKILPLIRPPAAITEEKFLNQCVRCGNCMKVCPTNGLQPVMLESGWAGIWTPRLVPDIGYCEYNCNLCGTVCPTGAIPRLELEKKQKIRIGIAKIDRNLCLPWAKNQECLVCEEHCPIPDKAIKFKKELVEGKIVLRPYIDPKLCTGCGICQTKCPLPRVRAVKVFAVNADRT